MRDWHGEHICSSIRLDRLGQARPRLLVSICNFFRIHATGEKEHKGGDTDKKKATRKIRVQCNLCFWCVDIGKQTSQKDVKGYS